ncbi:MAG: hypothetical protein FJW30_09480 [Acidobacteria bacterium]|nr:hypothetical protein [Acidobacteriota bacterium]
MRLLVFLASASLAFAQRDERWQADIANLIGTLQARHPNLYTQKPRQEWDAAVSALREKVPAMTDVEIAMELSRIVAFAKDSHTFLNLRTSPAFTSFPFRLSWFEEGWVLTSAPADSARSLGTVVRQIDNTPIEEVIEKLRPYIPHENESWFRVQAPNYLISPEILSALGILANRNSVTLNGEITITAAPASLWTGPFRAEPKFPLWARSLGFFYWFHVLPEAKTIYVKYNTCAEMPALPAGQFRASLEAALAAQPVERFIIDLRNNSGGNSAVLHRWLPALPETVKKVAIVGRQTFSSGELNAEELAQRGFTLVGENTGGMPGHFGEVVTISLNSLGLRGQFSTRAFRALVQAGNNTLRPDVEVPWTYAAFSEEEDPFLQAALTVP